MLMIRFYPRIYQFDYSTNPRFVKEYRRKACGGPAEVYIFAAIMYNVF